MRVVHTAIQAKEDLPRLMGAKLVQSDMGECFQQVRYYLDRGMDVFSLHRHPLSSGWPFTDFLGESPERLLPLMSCAAVFRLGCMEQDG